jgi:hypothetical protein
MLWIVLLIGLICPSEQRSLSMADFQAMVGTVGDDLGSQAAAQLPEVRVRSNIFFSAEICATDTL